MQEKIIIFALKALMSDFSFALEKWYKENGRLLPWRNAPTPYQVWLSEVMLQQTRVEAVKGYYDRFLKRYPTLPSLASSLLDEVNKLWEGLGYYSRARNLRNGAQKVMSDFDGELPTTQKELLTIPGIGEYTSKAILAIAFHQKYVAVDGNLIRVYSRLEESPLEAKSLEIKEKVNTYFFHHMDIDPSLFNQALMDLGELVCLPKGTPLCKSCPLRSYCKASASNKAALYPLVSPKKEKKEISLTVFVVSYQNSILIQKRPNKGLLASLFELPNVEKVMDAADVTLYFSKLGHHVSSVRYLGEKIHVFTHLKWKMKGFYVEVEETLPNELFVNEAELNRSYSLPSAFRHFEKDFFNHYDLDK